MISRTFTVYKTALGEGELGCYKGFNRRVDEITPFIAVVKNEDTYDLWGLDNNGPAVGQLVSYYEKEEVDGNWVLVGVFVNTRK